jgi:cytochrome c biogenesis protein CcdA
MIDYITKALQQTSTQPIGFLLVMMLGVLSAATSACCALPVLGVMIGYSGVQENMNKKLAFMKALFFTLGTIFSLMIIGGIAGFVGQVANASLGLYWKIFAGIMLIFMGLATLKILPFKIPLGQFDNIKNRIGLSGEILTGFFLGGLVAVNSLCCNPIIFGVIGAAVLQKQIFQATMFLFMFSIGFSLPLGAILFGVSLSKALFLPKNAEKIFRWIAGGILLIVGFYFLITF